MLIPILGPIVVMGWLVTGFWARRNEKWESFPPFEFSQFDKYLDRGLWPFLVTFVASLVITPVMFVMMIPLMIGQAAFFGNQSDASGCLFGVFALLVMFVAVIVMFGLMLAMVPLKLRAAMTQDFAQAFDLTFAKRFVALTWKEILLSALFILATGMLFSVIGMIAFCVGMYLAAVLTSFSWMHLHKQLYAIYLSRGGEPIPLSPKLSDTPPPLSVI